MALEFASFDMTIGANTDGHSTVLPEFENISDVSRLSRAFTQTVLTIQGGYYDTLSQVDIWERLAFKALDMKEKYQGRAGKQIISAIVDETLENLSEAKLKAF
jgi:hypothetical protein